MNKKVGFVSLGCAKNLTDTETMLGILTCNNFDITPDPEEADIIVVNTCAFIESAKEESIDAILDMAKYKENKCELLIVTGCLAQRYKKQIEEELPEVDIILGTTQYSKIFEAIDEYYNGGKKGAFVEDADKLVDYDLPRMQSTPFYSAYLKIADGCDNFCTYCIIPKLRGKYRSRPVSSIVSEAKRLAAGGVKELILVAQDTAYYGRDSGEKPEELLEKLSEIKGIEWIRLQYCYPENITDALINEIASNPKIVKYIDMPIQHISDNILKRMGRKSRQKEIEALIDELRRRIPGIVIRTSLITGFPGETEEDFEVMKKFLSEYKLDKVGVFTYSAEEGTPSAEFDGQTDEDTKQRRRAELMNIQQAVSYDINKAKIGTAVDIIIEGYDEENFCYTGRCSFDTPDVDGCAYVYSEYELNEGDIVRAEIIDCSEYDVTAKIIGRNIDIL